MAKLQYNAKVYEDTAANLATDETVFQANDLIFASDTGEFKKGNGLDAYADLPPIGGGEAPVAVTWDTLSDKPAVIGAGADAAAARTAIGAGTGNSNLAIGSTASTAAAGNHNHPVTADAASGLAAAATVQALAVALSARIKALEDAAV